MLRLAPTLLLALAPTVAQACADCRPAVLRLGLAPDRWPDIASMFIALAAMLAIVFFTRWEKMPWTDREPH